MSSFIRLFLCLTIFSVKAQQFTWVKGASQNGTLTGNYGTPGIASASNQPGNRHGCANWQDAQGRLWMFGGEGISAQPVLSWLNDLWRFDPQTQQWVWLQGSNAPDAPGIYGQQGQSAASNMPGAREFMMSWVDLQGNFWMFGGDGFGNSNTFGRLCDLWRFNPQTLQWTWMKGLATTDQFGIYGTQGQAHPANMPGSRYGSATWVDAQGNLWLYGGKGYAASGGDGNLSDLWMYNIQSNQWTWVKGSNAVNQTAVYGTQGLASANNLPGGLHFPGYWMHNNELYLYAGSGFGTAAQGYLGDVWKYSISSNQWTWIKGSGAVNQPGVYGSLGIGSASVLPGGRYSPVCWKASLSKVYLFGGYGFSSGPVGALNDFYVYDLTSNQFTWLKGSALAYTNGTYGIQGLAHPNHMPGSRRYNTYWTLPNGTCWLFGGLGSDANSPNPDNMQDLWKYDLPCNPDSITLVPNAALCPGSTFSLTAHAYYPGAVTWYSSAQGSLALGTGSVWVQSFSGAGSYTLYASQNACSLKPRTAISISVHPSPSVSVMGSSTLCAGNAVWLQATPLNSVALSGYTWSTAQTGPVIQFTPSLSGPVQVTVSSAQQCTQTASFSLTLVPVPTLGILSPSIICSGQSQVFTALGAASYSWNNQAGSSTYSVIPSGSVVAIQLSGSSFGNCLSTLSQTYPVIPSPVLTVQLSSGTLCAGVQQTLTASGASQYTWSVGGNNPVLVVTPALNTGIFLQGQQNSAGCLATWSAQAVPCISDVLNLNAHFWQLYPNPAASGVFLQGFTLAKGRYQLSDLMGKVLVNSVLFENGFIPLPALPEAVYVLQIFTQEHEPIREFKLLIKPN